MTRRGTVFLVEDDAALRSATVRLLQACGFSVRPFATAEEFLVGFDAALPGCLLLDVRLPGRSGLELQRTLESRAEVPPIVFLTGHADVPTSVFAMKRGAVDFLEKPVREEELIAALERALEKDEHARRERRERAGIEERYATLTAREREVLAEIVAGKLNKQTARALDIAERTVKHHRARVLEKMGAASVAELVRMAAALGIDGPRE